ncbi:MAG: outer membrane protein transport protein [Waddliaceae bacterium]
MKKLTLLFLFPFCLQALLIQPIGGAKSQGRANAQMAEPRDALVGAQNPAAMSFLGNRYDIGATWVHQEGSSTIRDNLLIDGTFNNSRTENFPFPDLAVNKQICECDFTLGFLAYTRAFVKSDYDTNFPFFGTSDLGLEYLHETFSPAFTIRLGTNHAFGITLDVHVLRMKINGLENLALPIFTDLPDYVTNNKYNYSVAVGTTIGWMSRVSDCVSVGFAWQPPVPARRFGKYKGFLADRGEWCIPHRIMGGVAVRALPCLSFEFDLEYIKWNGIQALDNTFFFPGTEGDETLLGDKYGPGFGWRDQLIARLGAEWKINQMASVRVGYQNSRAPMKGNSTLPNLLIPETPEDLVTFGGTWRFDCFNEISFFYAHAFQNQINGNESIPDLFFGGGEVDLSRTKDFFGVSWGRYF